MSGRIRVDDEKMQEGRESSAPGNSAINPADAPPDRPIAQEAERGGIQEGETRQEPAGAGEKPAESGETPDSFHRRIRTLTWEREQARREAAQARAEYEQLMSRARAAADPNEQAVQEAMQRIQQQRAQEEVQARNRSFDAACNATYIRGRTEFADFDGDVQALNAMGAEARRDILEIITSSPEGHKLYHQLAQDLDGTAELLKQPIGSVARKLMRMEMALEAPQAGNGLTGARPAPSRAPPPIRPIGGAGRGARRMEDLDVGDWIAQRDKDEWEARRRR